MRNFNTILSNILILIMLAGGSCQFGSGRKSGKPAENRLHGAVNHQSNLPFDSALLTNFFRSYPELKKYQEEVATVYRQHRFNQIWYDGQGVVEFGQTLFNKVAEIESEGVSSKFPYQEKVNGIFYDNIENTLSQTETDLMLTNLYLFYAEKVYKGLDDTTTTGLGWLLPRKKVSYTALLDSVVAGPGSVPHDDSLLFSQYYKLREVLRQYREIEKKGGWNPIDLDPKLKAYKPGDTAKAILQIRERLVVTGDLKQNNGSKSYDPELAEAVKRYQLRTGYNEEESILPKLINEMNIPIGDRIRKIIVNMERCRWISPGFARAKEYIVVNIPSFKLTMVRDGKQVFDCPVIVGNTMTKTVIFSGMLSYIVFSPYWNLPQSIINKEVKPGMAKNKNYLEKHNMEWNNGQVRQKPGKNNSLGLIKFIFPNSNDIYMHDTPAKSLFAKESRAFSHGCIRLGKPRDLAVTILENDPNWSPAKIDAAMHAGKESSYPLKSKIPVYIGYLTAWVDLQGAIHFYDDIYNRDGRLAELLYAEK
ncbi:MAG: L,D-transpeptidase family protein [Bacteroidales bacterium]